MNEKLESINLFKGYSQEENANTHAFLCFLNLLLNTGRKEFALFISKLKMKLVTQRINDINIDCLKQNHGATWDGQIYSKSKKWFIGIESKIHKGALNRRQLRHHISRVKGLKKQYNKVNLVLLTPFNKDWIIEEYLLGKPVKDVDYLSWGDIYTSAARLRPQSQSLGFIIDEYKKYLQNVNYEKAGIIQIVNKSNWFTDEQYNDVVAGRYTKFHIPAKRTGFDLPDFKVFVFDREKGGIFAFFTSKGMFLNRNRKRWEEFKYYFEITPKFKELRRPINAEDIRNIARKSKTANNLRDFKLHQCPTGCYFLNKDIVDRLEDMANKRIR